MSDSSPAISNDCELNERPRGNIDGNTGLSFSVNRIVVLSLKLADVTPVVV